MIIILVQNCMFSLMIVLQRGSKRYFLKGSDSKTSKNLIGTVFIELNLCISLKTIASSRG